MLPTNEACPGPYSNESEPSAIVGLPYVSTSVPRLDGTPATNTWKVRPVPTPAGKVHLMRDVVLALVSAHAYRPVDSEAVALKEPARPEGPKRIATPWRTKLKTPPMATTTAPEVSRAVMLPRPAGEPESKRRVPAVSVGTAKDRAPKRVEFRPFRVTVTSRL